VDLAEVEVDGRSFTLRPVGAEVLDAGDVVGAALAQSMGKPRPWGTAFLLANPALGAELYVTISGISGFDDD